MKAGSTSSKEKKTAFEELRYKYFPLEDDQTAKAFALLDPGQAKEKQLISGKEKDFKMNKRFLKTKFNREGKSNHRSPYSTILWPDNERCYPSNRVQNFEKIMNVSLKKYIDLFYQNRVLGNAFLEEINNTDSNIGIALMGSDSRCTTTDESCYLYKMVGKVAVKVGSSANKNVAFDILTRNQFFFGMEFKQCREKILLYGNITVER